MPDKCWPDIFVTMLGVSLLYVVTWFQRPIRFIRYYRRRVNIRVSRASVQSSRIIVGIGICRHQRYGTCLTYLLQVIITDRSPTRGCLKCQGENTGGLFEYSNCLCLANALGWCTSQKECWHFSHSLCLFLSGLNKFSNHRSALYCIYCEITIQRRTLYQALYTR